MTEPPVRHGAVAVVRRDEKLLVIRRSLTVAAPGAYCFPGGGIEAGESEETALVRELHEELSLPVVPLRRLFRCRTPWNVELAWWLVDHDPSHEPIPNPAEVASVHWHGLEEIAALPGLLRSNHDFLEALARGEFSL